MGRASDAEDDRVLEGVPVQPQEDR
jgi:hypothetical protein